MSKNVKDAGKDTVTTTDILLGPWPISQMKVAGIIHPTLYDLSLLIDRWSQMVSLPLFDVIFIVFMPSGLLRYDCSNTNNSYLCGVLEKLWGNAY